jgi:tRNA threonylcarbamoyladenosine biosynthesis protein TsaB
VLTDALRGERFAQPVERLASGWAELAPATIVSADASRDAAQRWSAAVLDTVSAPLEIDARAWVTLAPYATRGVSLATWEPHYGRLAEAQVKWEATAGHALSVPAPVVDVGGGP